jgi:quinol-cytochrome oxidoreductase complex cytochrome b subunit
MPTKDIRSYENLHIVLWLVKDTCWVLDFKVPGLIMIFPTILVALHITWLHRKEVTELYHNLAVVAWICANTTWMIGEFFYNDTLRPIATVFFTIGLLLVAVYYLIVRPSARKKEN